MTSVTLDLPATLAGGAGRSRFEVDLGASWTAGAPATVGDVLDALARLRPAVERRLRDETGRIRRYVNVYVDGEDVRRTGLAATPVANGSEVLVIPSVAGG